MWPPPRRSGWSRASTCRLGVVVLLVAAAALLFQPAQRRMERLADRWVFGARLDGYEVLTRFGAMLETSPGRPTCCPGSRPRYATGSACNGPGCGSTSGRWPRATLPGLPGHAGSPPVVGRLT